VKISTKSINIPPYISTHWRNVESLHTSDGLLLISLKSGDTVYVPNLTEEQTATIFKAHGEFLEQQDQDDARVVEEGHQDAAPADNPFSELLSGLLGGKFASQPLHINIGPLENLSEFMQHNPGQANAPDLPPDILGKMATMTKWVSPEVAQMLPKAEPHCNCYYCQVSRVLSGTETTHTEEAPATETEEPPEDLHFQQWEIQEIGDKLYSVTNKLDTNESYRVFLGEPVGCTCGKPGCEHIISVLQS
jgi:hypothetical protein